MKKYNDIKSRRDEYFSDRPIGIGSSMNQEAWEEIESKYLRMIEDGEDIQDISLAEIQQRLEE